MDKEERKVMKKSYKEYLEAVNDIIDFAKSDECSGSGESYWRSKSGESFTIDVGYFFDGLEAFRAYFKKKLDEENENEHKRPINVQCCLCKKHFELGENSRAYQEYSPVYVNGQDVDRWIWNARCPHCKGYVPVTEVEINE